MSYYFGCLCWTVSHSHIVVHVLIRVRLRWLHMTDAPRVPIAHLLENVLIGSGGRVLAQDPRVLLDLLSTQSLVGVGDEELADEVLGFGRDGGPGACVEIVVASLDFLEECKVVLIVEGRRP